MSTITKQSKAKLITIKYYLTGEEFVEFQKQAILMYEHKVIPRATVGAFAKAAGYKWFNEINKKAAENAQNK